MKKILIPVVLSFAIAGCGIIDIPFIPGI